MKEFILDWIKIATLFGQIIAFRIIGLLVFIVPLAIIFNFTAAWQIVILFLALTFCLTMLTR